MKPTRYLLLLPLLAFTAADWQSFALDKKVSVQLPAPPTEIDLTKLAPAQTLPHSRAWVLRATEGLYQVVRLPNTHLIARVDTAGLRSFYAGVLNSIIRNENGQLLTITPFLTTSGPGIEYKYRALAKGTSRHVIKYSRFLVVDSAGYSLNFLPADQQDSLGLAGAEQRRRFFNSITVKP